MFRQFTRKFSFSTFHNSKYVRSRLLDSKTKFKYLINQYKRNRLFMKDGTKSIRHYTNLFLRRKIGGNVPLIRDNKKHIANSPDSDSNPLLRRTTDYLNDCPKIMDICEKLDEEMDEIKELRHCEDPYSLAFNFGKVCDSVGLGYAIGGSIALNFYSDERNTKDADVNIYGLVDKQQYALEYGRFMKKLGFERVEAFRLMPPQWGKFEYWIIRGEMNGVALELFPPIENFYIYELALRDATKQDTPYGKAFVQSRTSIVAFKLGFGRLKDYADIVEMMMYDPSWIESTRLDLLDVFEKDSPQLTKFDELVEESKKQSN